ncbi:MAG TPA: hypothetical protein VNK70_03240 [Candidatus Paceibacterota bacterium]|nr:hypothetical protein [Candidatus Paceibacterota bacterium]
MKRFTLLLALAVVALSCKDGTGPVENVKPSFSITVSAERALVQLTANRPAEWQLCYGVLACTDTLPAPGNWFGPARGYSPILNNLNPRTNYVCVASARDAGVVVRIGCDFETKEVSLTIWPETVTVDIASSFRFTARFNEPIANQAVEWRTTVGAIDSTGWFTSSPSSPGNGTVTGCSRAYPTICDTSAVTIARFDLILFWRMEETPSIRCDQMRCQEIYAILSDGSGVRRVTTTTWFQDLEPVWFPGGRRFAFVRSRAGTTQTVCLANADGSGLKCLDLPGVNMSYQAVSPDGQWIVFQYRDELPDFTVIEGGIAIADTNGANMRRIIRVEQGTGTIGCFPHNPNWSPDGQWIAFADCNGQIWRMSPDGGNLVQLTRNDLRNASPVWSPDGRRIAFVATPSPGVIAAQIYVMNADGSNAVRVTNDPIGAIDPTWSPDGRRIAYGGGCCWPETMDIFVINADGSGEPVNITNSRTAERFPAWRP